MMHHSFNTDGKKKPCPLVTVATAGLLVILRWCVDFLQLPSWLKRCHWNELWHFLLITSSVHSGGKKVAYCSSVLFFKTEKPIYWLLAFASVRPLLIETQFKSCWRKINHRGIHCICNTQISPHIVCDMGKSFSNWSRCLTKHRHSHCWPTESKLEIFHSQGLSNTTVSFLWLSYCSALFVCCQILSLGHVARSHNWDYFILITSLMLHSTPLEIILSFLE